MTDDLAVPQSRDALAAHLEALGVREGTYHLFGAHLEDAMVMDQRPEGWVVFYSERGGEYSRSVYGDEASACADLLSRLGSESHVFSDLVAGPAPAAEADAAFDGWLKQRGVTRSHLAATDWEYDDVPWVPGAVLEALLREDHGYSAGGRNALICRDKPPVFNGGTSSEAGALGLRAAWLDPSTSYGSLPNQATPMSRMILVGSCWQAFVSSRAA